MQIEADVPAPAANQRATKYPWRLLEVGESFWTETSPNALHAGAWTWSKKLGYQFRVRKDGDGTRVWRVG